MTKHQKTSLIFTICGVLAAVILCGVFGNATSGFTEFDPEIVFSKDLNEKNLLRDTYKVFEEEVSAEGVKFTNKKSVICIDGKISDKDSAADAVLELATVELDEGEYTFTCFGDNSKATTYYAYLIWQTADGEKHVAFADWKNPKVTVPGATVDGGYTFEVTEDVEAEVVIVACKGNEFDNVKGYPCIVEGDKAGDFYAKAFDLFD